MPRLTARPLLWIALLAAMGLAVSLSGCSCCLYFNHWYNASDAYEEASRLRLARLDSLPEDTLWVTPEEEAQYRRVIEKCSRILERWPEEEDYKPKILFTMAESHRRIGEWGRAVRKYDEYLRYFPDGAFFPDAEYERAFSLFKSGQPEPALFALEPIVSDTAHKRHTDALVLFAQLEQLQGRAGNAIDAIERMLAAPGGTPLLRAQMKLRLARLYAQEEQHAKAIPFFLSPDLKMLAPPQPWEAQFEAARSHSVLEQHSEAIDLLRALARDSLYADRKTKVEMTLAAELLRLDPPDEGLQLLFRLISENPRSAIAAEGWYRLGLYAEKQLRNFDRAISDYDSATAQPPGEWERKARERRSILQRIAHQRTLSLDTTAVKNWSEEFQIAELFLFRLDQTDSALTRLHTLAEDSAVDVPIRQRAAYARAFILGAIAGDTAAANVEWRALIEAWPSTDYAQQAQRNLGLPVTVMTQEDSAHVAFLAAESLLVDDGAPELINALRKEAIEKLLKIDSLWPETETSGKALYTAARLRLMIGETDAARELFLRLQTNWGNTPLGIDAAKRLSGFIVNTDALIKAEENMLKSMAEYNAQQPSYQQKFEEYKKEREKQQKEEEELLWDYEEMYNLGD